MLETRVQSLGWEDLLEKETATHSSNLSWKIPWMEEPRRLQSMGSQRVGHDWATSLSLFHFLLNTPISTTTAENDLGDYIEACKTSFSIFSAIQVMNEPVWTPALLTDSPHPCRHLSRPVSPSLPPTETHPQPSPQPPALLTLSFSPNFPSPHSYLSCWF